MQILVLAPHADDETYGCGGMIAKRAAEGAEVHVIVAAISTVTFPDGSPKCTPEQRKAELKAACDALGVAEFHVLYSEIENKLDSQPMQDLIMKFDRLLETHNYDQIFIPGPSHHQDHRTVQAAAWSALRIHPRRQLERLTAAYELAYGNWSPDLPPLGGSLYIDIENHLEAKLAALAAYSTQTRESPDPLSPEGVRRLAQLRGTECGCDVAERFSILRAFD